MWLPQREARESGKKADVAWGIHPGSRRGLPGVDDGVGRGRFKRGAAAR